MKRRKIRRQFITDPFEADAYARWYNAQPRDPSRVYGDPIAVFRAQQTKQQ